MASIFASTRNTRVLPAGGGRFIRSECPTRLTDGELAWLRDRGVTTVVDLREQEECSQRPCRLEGEQGFTYYHMPVTGGGDAPETPEQLRRIYLGMLDGQMDRIVDTILNAPGGVLYFCGAGKDRTGVVSAVLLKRLGCNDQTIVDDYMQTKENLMDVLTEYANKYPELDLRLLIPDEENIRLVLGALAERAG